MVPFSRKVGHDTVKECFRCVCMDPNRDTGDLAEAWRSACCPNVLITSPGGQKSAQIPTPGTHTRRPCAMNWDKSQRTKPEKVDTGP